jgi:transposase
MALALSDDRRRRVVAAVEDGMSCRAVAVRFGIAPSTAIKWLQQWRRTGSVQSQPRGVVHPEVWNFS